MTDSFTISGQQFLRDGVPHQIISGAVHYFRIPHPLWEDRLRRLLAMGANAVETYVAWNFHVPHAGTAPDFTAGADLGGFIDLAGALGLDVIVRPGPYICAEWDLGGFPSWLLADDAAAGALRTSDPAYLAHVGAWFDVLIPIIAERQLTRGGPVIAVQAENEYGSYGNDADYLRAMVDGLRARGIDVPLFTSDGPEPLMLAGGTVPGLLATANFGSRQAEAFAELARVRPDQPGMCMEFWNGWFDHWGTPHHRRDAASAAEELAGMLADGRSVNFYMAHGGTNFGVWAGANCHDLEDDAAEPQYQPTITSYDYDAPIAEDGTLTAKFDAFRDVIAAHTGRTPPAPPPPAARLAPRAVEVTATLDLAAVLDGVAPIRGAIPRSFERLGIHHGVVRYLTTVDATTTPIPPADLHLDGLADLASVVVNGALIGRLGRTRADAAYGPARDGLRITLDRPVNTIEITVASLGRVNFGRHLRDEKGLRAVRYSHQHLFSWTHAGLDLTTLPELDWTAAATAAVGPVGGLHRAVVELTEQDRARDAYIALPGWHHGHVFLNGFNLGRYWNPAGPQRTLYAPAPLWRAGANELVIAELTLPADAPGGPIEIRDTPQLG
ncbi:beta-galactosidase [Occultella glacieicola]|uniref:Beta-galactosidase n=1 Tax=Occultella glacieicola TaxID=2518684 RepID=A0ABY2E638_9MICO|nr:beta-galactosidase family protein [Occultella glacieicola]TDE96047.1 beta-galactosidase [Occultella glacieicola]